MADAQLWAEYCHTLERAGEVVLRDKAPGGSPQARVSAARLVEFATEAIRARHRGALSTTAHPSGSSRTPWP